MTMQELKPNKTQLNWIKTARSLIVYHKGNPLLLNAGTEKFDRALKLIGAKKEKEVIDYLFPSKEKFEQDYSKGNFKAKDNQVFIKGDSKPVPEVLGKKIIEFYRGGHPYQPLVKFWENLKKNPSEKSRQQLYGFLRANKFPITPEGFFLAYKGVTEVNGKLVDTHTRSIKHDIGCTPTMKRSEVDPNENNTCSTGLHVAAYEYAAHTYGGTLITILVDPKDVVTVPTDYNAQKMRTCRYKVVGLGKLEIQDLYIDAKTLRIQKKAAIGTLKVKQQETGKGEKISLKELTAKEVIELVAKKVNQKITLGLKDKRGIINKAVKILKGFNFKVVV